MFLRRKTTPRPEPKSIYGVNLGGWLVLEKWMTPSLFEGTDAIDEYSYSQKVGAGFTKKLKDHRSTFITRADFAWLQLHGIKAVRLPVGYWVFGGEEPYEPTIDYVDMAFKWGEETGIKILIDMHGAPGSQNGQDHSGKSGGIKWHKDEANIIKTLDVITKLTERYKDSSSLLGIELLNEPSWKIPRRKLLKYYTAAYQTIRARLGGDIWIVFSDNFRPRRWKRKLRRPEFTGMYIDRHEYQIFSKKDRRMDILSHLKRTLAAVPKELARARRYHPVIIGEWSLALDPSPMRELNEMQLDAAMRMYGSAQLYAYEGSSAWFYWSYKTEYGGPWSYRDCVEKGWLPKLSA
jgi:glucan 1,3-beta-glucosidase